MSCIVSEEMSYNGCSALGWPVHSDIVMPYMSKYGSDEQKEWLPSMVSGRVKKTEAYIETRVQKNFYVLQKVLMNLVNF